MTLTIAGIAYGGKLGFVAEIYCAGGSQVIVRSFGDADGLSFGLINPNGIPCGGSGAGHYQLDGHRGARNLMVWADSRIASKAYEVAIEYAPGADGNMCEGVYLPAVHCKEDQQ